MITLLTSISKHSGYPLLLGHHLAELATQRPAQHHAAISSYLLISPPPSCYLVSDELFILLQFSQAIYLTAYIFDCLTLRVYDSITSSLSHKEAADEIKSDQRDAAARLY